MITAAVLAGIAVGLLGLAALIVALAMFVKAVALLLPPAGQFLGDVQSVRDWMAQAARRGAAPSWVSGEMAGVAPAPAEGPTSAEVASGLTGGDLDRFDDVSEERPLSPGSRHAAPPPG